VLALGYVLQPHRGKKGGQRAARASAADRRVALSKLAWAWCNRRLARQRFFTA
jgi:hypothetical protein